MSQEQIDSSTKKRIKLNEQDQKEDNRDWIVIKKKTTPLTISISDHTKVHRFYSHKSIQKYIRYLFTQTCVNPMWLAIKRQSQIQHIYYIDIEIEDYLFQKMLQQKTPHFLSQKITGDNKAVFREQKLNRFLWDSLLVYDEEQKLAKQEAIQQIVNSNRVQKKMSAQIYRKYLSSILTPQELKENLYPDVKLPLYQTYHTIIPKQQLYFNNTTITNTNNNNTQQNLQQQQPTDKNDKNLILVIDCEMVSTQQGFELARCTIVNYQQEVIFDEFFKPKNPIISYNTEYSGITKEILDPITNTIENTLYPYLTKMITPDTILIGHSLENDYNAMKFYHPKVVDTSVLFRRKNGSKMKLKNLADKILNRKIQSFTHDSKEDCLATLHLVQAKVENQELINFQKQYHLLRDLVKAKHGILVVDYDIQNMKQYNSIHFQKVQPCESPQKITQIIKRYSNKTQVSVPKAAFTRFQKPETKDWQIYYEQIDHALEKLYNAVPQGTVFFLNFQVNELVRIVPFSAQQANKQRTRPFFAPIPKNN